MRQTGARPFYEIVESADDPNRPWHVVMRAVPDGQAVPCIRFRTYGEAWREVERRKIAESEHQDDLFTQADQR